MGAQAALQRGIGKLIHVATQQPDATRAGHPLRKHLQSGSTILRILILATLLALRSLRMERPYILCVAELDAKLGLADPDAVRTPGYQVVGVTGHNAVGVGKF